MQPPRTLRIWDGLELLDDVVEGSSLVIAIESDSSSSTIVSYINIRRTVRTELDTKNKPNYTQC